MQLARHSEVAINGPIDVPGSRLCDCAEIATHIREQKPLLYLRFSDGEFHSIFHSSRRGRRNADGHLYAPATMGAELRNVFEQAFETAPHDPAIRIELSECWSQWSALRDYLGALPKPQRAAIAHGEMWTRAVIDGDVFGVMEAVRASAQPKLFLGKEDLAPVADGLGAVHVPARYPDAYLALDDIQRRTEAILPDEPSIMLCSLGMASECLLWRLWRGVGVWLDFGHVPEAMMGRSPRKYLRRQRRGLKTGRRFRRWVTGGQ